MRKDASSVDADRGKKDFNAEGKKRSASSCKGRQSSASSSSGKNPSKEKVVLDVCSEQRRIEFEREAGSKRGEKRDSSTTFLGE